MKWSYKFQSVYSQYFCWYYHRLVAVTLSLLWLHCFRPSQEHYHSTMVILVIKINPEYSLEGLMLKMKLQYFGHLMRRANSLEKVLMLGKTESKRRRGWQRMRWLDSITASRDMNLNKLWKIVKDREVTKSQTQLSDWTTTNFQSTFTFHLMFVSFSFTEYWNFKSYEFWPLTQS